MNLYAIQLIEADEHNRIVLAREEYQTYLMKIAREWLASEKEKSVQAD